MRIGRHALIGDHAAIREGATLGDDVAVGFATNIKYGVELHDRVRLQFHCAIGAGVVFEADVVDPSA